MFCLDTNVVIFAINRRRPEIAERLDREIASGTPIFVPAIVLFELEYGCANSTRPEQSRRALEIFLSAGFDQPAFVPRTRAQAARSALCSNRAGSRLDHTTR
jgi:tRNA(fMet)-specific endonuclease VapC